MKPIKTLRRRLTGAFLIISATVSFLYGCLVYLAMKHTEDDILNRRILLEAQYYIQQYHLNPETARLPHSIGLKSYLSSSPDLPALLRAQPLGIRELDDKEIHVGVLNIPESNERLYLALSELESSSLERELSSLLLVLITVGLAITSIGLMIGLLFSRTIANPLIQLTRDVEGTNRDRNKPFYGSDRNDEVGALSRAFTQLVNRLNDFLEREKHFTQYASHELRTPIALIKNAVAVLRLPQQDPARHHRNLGRIESATIELESLVNTFLTLGRESTCQEENVDVIEIIKKNLKRNERVNQNKKFALHMDLTEEPHPLMTDAKLVDILIDNIIRNMYEHGSTQARITVQSRTIVFKNNVLTQHTRPAGIPTLPQENKASFGLEIINKLAQRCGFQLHTTHDGSCYTLTLTFPP